MGRKGRGGEGREEREEGGGDPHCTHTCLTTFPTLFTTAAPLTHSDYSPTFSVFIARCILPHVSYVGARGDTCYYFTVGSVAGVLVDGRCGCGLLLPY